MCIRGYKLPLLLCGVLLTGTLLHMGVSPAIGDVTLPDITLINGDVDGDNEITSTDLSVLGLALGSVSGDTNWDARADLDGDGEITSTDLSILGLNLGMAGDS